MSEPAHILIVEDSPEPLALTVQTLRLRGFTYEVARKAEEAFEKLKGISFDLILLDLGLPDMDGLEVCKRLREDPTTVDIPIIMLTGRSAASDKIAGLELGADDYVAKPFDPGELVARIHAALRRRQTVRATPDFAALGLTLDAKTRHARLGDQDLKLTSKEFDLLALLLRTPGEPVAREDICRLIWDKSAEESSRSLETHVWSLRNKLGPIEKHLETVGKIGYRFNPAV
jgi:DNA-binding response OmpR family regulator